MSSTVKVLLYLIFALTASVVFLGIFAKDKTETKYGEGVYYTRFGGVYCGSVEITPCGVTLRKCTDDRAYFCVHDLATKEEYLKE